MQLISNPPIDWSKLKIRCSCLGLIMTEAKDKTTKDNGGLGKTAISHLVKIYGWEKYGRRKDIITAAMQKGTGVEEESIDLVSSVENVFYKKNSAQVENDYFKGTPDLFTGTNITKAKLIKDIKSSWDLETFLKNEVEDLNKIYYWQLQGYMAITGAKSATLDYCLVNTPPHLILAEKKKLFYQLNVATEDNPDYLAACAELEYNMIFDDIPETERVIQIPVARNDNDIKKAEKRVLKCREWFAEFDVKRTSRFKKVA